jgi:hypothetical protein
MRKIMFDDQNINIKTTRAIDERKKKKKEYRAQVYIYVL